MGSKNPNSVKGLIILCEINKFHRLITNAPNMGSSFKRAFEYTTN